MICIAITQEALDVLVRTQPPGTVDYEVEVNAKGEQLVWMEDPQMWRLASMRGPGEGYSDVIIRLARPER
jgi:hypothetical protein